MHRFPLPLPGSRIWFAAFALWFLTLWFLSGRPVPAGAQVNLPGLDKVLHVLYFFSGAIILSLALHRRGQRGHLTFPRSLFIIVISLGMIGALDEWHQSWIPARSGNDLGDWTADLSGAFAGALIYQALRHRVRK